jgi:TorA maturation chaperone TorD
MDREVAIMQTLQDNHKELYMNLGDVALDRFFMYQLLEEVVQFPTLELSEVLLNGTLYTNVDHAVGWVNKSSGIFDNELKQFEELSQKKANTIEFFHNLEEQYRKFFLPSGEFIVSPFERTYSEDGATGLIDIYKEETEFVLIDSVVPDHLINELHFLAFLCKKEGEAWHEGKMPKAKQWRRKERDFTVNHLGKWGLKFFMDFEKTADFPAYKAFASLGKIFMKLEQGY